MAWRPGRAERYTGITEFRDSAPFASRNNSTHANRLPSGEIAVSAKWRTENAWSMVLAMFEESDENKKALGTPATKTKANNVALRFIE